MYMASQTISAYVTFAEEIFDTKEYNFNTGWPAISPTNWCQNYQ